MLSSGNSELGDVEIKWHIFQGESLSPLVFVLALILALSLILRKVKAGLWVFRKQRLIIFIYRWFEVV